MALPLFQLLQTEDTIEIPGAIVGERYHEEEANTYQWKIEIPEGHVVLTVWQGKLHQVIYQTPADDECAAAERNAALFEHYGDGHSFNEILDTGFGKTYRRADLQRYALWSYFMDFTTVGTMDFQAIEPSVRHGMNERRSGRSAQYYHHEYLTNLLERAQTARAEVSDELARIEHPHAINNDFTALLLVQPRSTRRTEGGNVDWLNAAPDREDCLQVADVVEVHKDGAVIWWGFPIPSDFPLDKVTYDGDGMFSLWAGLERMACTLPQIRLAMQGIRFTTSGLNEKDIARAFRSLPAYGGVWVAPQ